MEYDSVTVTGRCHCGNISLHAQWPEEIPEISARACSCSFCIKHGNVWTSHPNTNLRICISNESNISRYEFETKTAQFFVCKICGVVPVAISKIENNTYAVVNINCIEPSQRLTIKQETVSHSNESVSERLQRRKRNWISKVTIEESMPHNNR